MLYTQTIDASGALDLAVAGKLFLLADTGAAASVTVDLQRGGSRYFRAPGMTRGFRVFTEAGFSGIRIEAAAGTIVKFFIANENIQISTIDGSAVTVPGGVKVTNVPGEEIPVLFAGVVTPVVGLLTQAATITDTGLKAATAVRAVLLAAAATRRGFRVRNAGPDPVAIGGALVTFATAAVILQAGDVWVESEGAPGAWSCICDAAKSASLYVLELAV